MKNTIFEALIQRHPGISSQKDLLCYVLAALTWSIAKADGAIQDEEKSEIPKIIEGLGVISTRSQSRKTKKRQPLLNLSQQNTAIAYIAQPFGPFELNQQ